MANTPGTAKVGTTQATNAPTSLDTASFSKVARMRAAIEAGTFKVDAGSIADALLKRGDLTNNI